MASSDTAELSETFDLLAHPHRRYLLYYLRTEFEVVDIETVATAIAGWVEDDARTNGDTDSKAVETGLRHTHLPKLADAGIVTFDATTGAIELETANGHGQFIDEAARIDGYRQTTADD